MYACKAPVGYSKGCTLGISNKRTLVHPTGTSGDNRQSRSIRGVVLARSSEDRWPTPSSYKIWPTEISISASAYNAILGAELLAYGALADAGFSGDWSRIGVLTTDQELLAQQILWFIAAAHSVVAALTVRLALQEGYPVLLAGVKGFVFGSLGLYDVYLRCEQDKKLRV